MGIDKPQIVKVDDDFVWKGEKNTSMYDDFFTQLLLKVFDSSNFMLLLDKRRV